MVPFYDRAGRPISAETWHEFFNDMAYRRIALDHVGPYTVSTVWLGIDHGFGRRPKPLIFETMVFQKDGFEGVEGGDMLDLDCQRYATEEQAREGHAEMVVVVSATVPEVPDSPEGIILDRHGE